MMLHRPVELAVLSGIAGRPSHIAQYDLAACESFDKAK